MTSLAPSVPLAPRPAAAPTGATFGTEPPMSEEEVDAAICINSPLLVAEVYEATRRNVENYGAKLARLDQKATSLLGAVGFSLTVAGTYGGQFVMGHAKDMAPGRWHVVVILFWLALFAGTGAGILAAAALFVGDHAEPSDRAIFNAKELREADATEPEDQARGLASYRRSVTLHLWLITKQRAGKMQKKAKALRAGQWFFLIFLVMLLVVSGEIVTRLA